MAYMSFFVWPEVVKFNFSTSNIIEKLVAGVIVKSLRILE